MFENILFQDRAVQQIKLVFQNQAIAPAWLIHGPPVSGKLTFALEFARVLTCKEKVRGAWGCRCSSCQSHYLLNSPNLVLGGYKDFLGEVKLSSRALSKNPDIPKQRFHFYRAVKKVLKRIDPLFWDESDPKFKALTAPAEDLVELLEDFHPQRQLEKKDLDKLEKILKLCEKLENLLPEQGIGIEGIRNITQWAKTTSALGYRVIIIENADRLLSASRNALLKVLEEPPSEVVFALLTRHRAAIIPTILSRLRSLELVERTQEQMKQIGREIFQLDNEQSLHTGLQGSGEHEFVESFTNNFWNSAKEKKDLPSRWELKETDFHAFLDRLAFKLLAESRQSGPESLENYYQVLEQFHHAVVARDVFHQEITGVLDEIYIAVRGVL